MSKQATWVGVRDEVIITCSHKGRRKYRFIYKSCEPSTLGRWRYTLDRLRGQERVAARGQRYWVRAPMSAELCINDLNLWLNVSAN